MLIICMINLSINSWCTSYQLCGWCIMMRGHSMLREHNGPTAMIGVCLTINLYFRTNWSWNPVFVNIKNLKTTLANSTKKRLRSLTCSDIKLLKWNQCMIGVVFSSRWFCILTPSLVFSGSQELELYIMLSLLVDSNG